jgi:RNA polymerase sigma-70 factor (ECF subfamily)
MSLCACNEIINPFRQFTVKMAFPLVAPFERVTQPVPLEQDKDVELLGRIANRDRDAFAEFYDRHSTLLFSVACKILNDQTDAEDVVQESFVQIWEKAANFDSKLGKASSWAATMTRNKAIDRIRASQRRTRLAEEAGSEMAIANESDATVNEAVHGHDKAKLIQTAIVTLPTEQRQAIELAYFSGLTQHEISEKLKQPLGTIKARIRRGMLKLRDQLEGLL